MLADVNSATRGGTASDSLGLTDGQASARRNASLSTFSPLQTGATRFLAGLFLNVPGGATKYRVPGRRPARLHFPAGQSLIKAAVFA